MTIQDDPFISEILESHVPERREIAPDWVNVLRRAGLGGRSRRLSRRSLLIAFATILVTLIASALAISSEYQWWFLSEEGMGPAPSKEGVVIVARGTWSGHDWILFAYRTTDLGADGTSKEGICVGFLRGGLPSGRGGSMGCGAIPSGSRGHPGELSFVSSPRPEKGLPALVYGPVVASASHVRIEFVDGNSIEAKTIAAPRQLGLSVGFFAVPLPCGKGVARISAIDYQGDVVARIDNVAAVLSRFAPACTSEGAGVPEPASPARGKPSAGPAKATG